MTGVGLEGEQLMARHRDLVIEHLAASETCLAEEAARWREQSLAALAALHNREVEIGRLRAQLSGLRDELRRYTATAVAGRRAA